MLGQKDFKPKLFYSVQLENLVPEDHELRQILRAIDFEPVRVKVCDKYSYTGQPSVDPAVIIKMLFLGYYYGINSERKLSKEIVVNNAFRWFLGYDLDETTPNHSVLSKARSRYGIEVFQSLFDQIVGQCVEHGLVSGKKAFVDATLIEANASEESLVPRIQIMCPSEYAEHMMKDSEDSDAQNDSDKDGPPEKFNEKMVSTTDPDATYIDRGKKAGLNYEGHYLVDGDNKIIVSAKTTNTLDNAGNYVKELLQTALFRHGLKFKSFCGDAEYGTQSVYAFLFGQDVMPYIPPAETGRKDKDKFSKPQFEYDEERDIYACPAGKHLNKISLDVPKQQTKYRAKAKDCNNCALRKQCTTSKSGRSVKRLFYEKEVNAARMLMTTPEYMEHIKKRRIVVEPLFSEAKDCHGLRMAKYRGMTKVGIQLLLTATVQNIKRLVKATIRPNARAITVLSKQIGQYLRFFIERMLSLLNCQRTCNQPVHYC